MKQLKTYRYKLKTTPDQNLVLRQWLGGCRYIYNLCLEYRMTLWQDYHLNLSKNQAQKELAVLAREVPWLANVNSQTRQEVIERLWRAYDGFFKRGNGFPKFAHRDRYRSFVFKQGIRLHPNASRIQLPKLGTMELQQFTGGFF